MTEENNEIVNKLVQHEESIGKLYEIYARIFPQLYEFWTLLSREENQHATWIRTLGLQSREESKLFTNERRFNTTAIDTSLDYLRRESEKANKQSITVVEALNVAFYIEQSLLERRWFEIFETDSVELKHLLTKLDNETKKHRAKLKETLEQQSNV